MLLEDEDLIMEVQDKIKGEGLPAARALSEGMRNYCLMISQLDDPYLREKGSGSSRYRKKMDKKHLGNKN